MNDTDLFDDIHHHFLYQTSNKATQKGNWCSMDTSVMHKSAEMCIKAIHFSFSSFEPIAMPGEQMTDTKGAFRASFLTVTIRNYRQ